ncbi:MAG: ECF-type sigma factor, partial [Rubripirellula sp.]
LRVRTSGRCRFGVAMMTESPESITVWFEQLREGDPNAAEKLWSRFFDRLVGVAREQLATANRRMADEEDIAIGVMAALCQCADRGKLPSIENRNDLWRLLVKWTQHDVIDHVRNSKRAKRGSNAVWGDSIFAEADREGGFDVFADLVATPSVLLEMDEQFRLLLDRLPDAKLKQLALRKMEGFTNEELAEQAGVSPRTIERKLKLIRDFWS